MTSLVINNPNVTVTVSPSGLYGKSDVGFFIYQAGEPLNAGVAVVIFGGKAIKFDPYNPLHTNGIAGVTKHSADTGDFVEIVFAGVMLDAAFVFPPDVSLYAGAGGQITAVPLPPPAIFANVGLSLGSNKILVNIKAIVKTH